MKRIVPLVVLALSFLFVSPAPLTSAAPDGSEVNGSFQFSTDSGQTSSIDFNVTEERDGSTVGEMTFAQDRLESNGGSQSSDQAATPFKFYLKAQFDCLVIEKNKAIISGTVSEANVQSYIGRRVLLVVQDNGHGAEGKKQDRLTWGLYRVPKVDWLPSDSERPDDQPGTPTWVAQDAERADDPGVLSTQNEVVGCSTFPLSAFSFVDKKRGHGKIHVSP
jgi:hypothetical protein